MATALANIKVGITLAAKAFNRDIKKTSKNVKKFNKNLGFMKKAAIGITAIFGTRIAAGSILQTFNERRGVIDKVGKFADELGFSTEKLTSLQFAAQLTGTNVQILNKGLQIFTRRIGEAVQGTGEARKGLDRLGLSAQNLSKMATDEAFKLVADRINMLGTQTEKAGVSFMFFSRQGQDLLNLLQLGSSGLDEISKLIESFGGELNRFEVKKVEEMNDSFERLGLVLNVAKDRFISVLSPAIDFATKKFQDFIRPLVFIDRTVDQLRITINKFRKPLSITLNLILIFGKSITLVFNTLSFVVTRAISTVLKFVGLVAGEKFQKSLRDLDEFFTAAGDKTGAAAVKNLKDIAGTFLDISSSDFLSGLEKSLDAFDELAAGKPNSVTSILQDMEEQAKATIKALNFQQVVRQFKALNDKSTDLSFLNKLKDAGDALTGGIPATLPSTINESTRNFSQKEKKAFSGAASTFLGGGGEVDKSIHPIAAALKNALTDPKVLAKMSLQAMVAPRNRGGISPMGVIPGAGLGNIEVTSLLQSILDLLRGPIEQLDNEPLFFTNVPGALAR